MQRETQTNLELRQYDKWSFLGMLYPVRPDG